MPDAILAALDRLRELVEKYDPNQPRVPAGSPEGGQWGEGGNGNSESAQSSLPSARNLVTGGDPGQQRLVLEQISESRIPNLHLDGLSGIQIISREQAESVNSNSYYRADDGKIFMTTASIANSAITPFGQDPYRPVVHEIAHHVFARKLTPEAVREWKTISNRGKNAKVSDYARKNLAEHFAEAYRVFTTRQTTLEFLEPAAYTFMKSIMALNSPKVFPPGKTEKPGDPVFRRLFGR